MMSKHVLWHFDAQVVWGRMAPYWALVGARWAFSPREQARWRGGGGQPRAVDQAQHMLSSAVSRPVFIPLLPVSTQTVSVWLWSHWLPKRQCLWVRTLLVIIQYCQGVLRVRGNSRAGMRGWLAENPFSTHGKTAHTCSFELKLPSVSYRSLMGLNDHTWETSHPSPLLIDGCVWGQSPRR